MAFFAASRAKDPRVKDLDPSWEARDLGGAVSVEKGGGTDGLLNGDMGISKSTGYLNLGSL